MPSDGAFGLHVASGGHQLPQAQISVETGVGYSDGSGGGVSAFAPGNPAFWVAVYFWLSVFWFLFLYWGFRGAVYS